MRARYGCLLWVHSLICVLHLLTHWGWVTHICISKLTIIGSDNGLSPDRLQAIIWTNAGLLLIGPLGTNFSEILIEILTFSLKKMRLKSVVCETAAILSQPQCVNAPSYIISCYNRLYYMEVWLHSQNKTIGHQWDPYIWGVFREFKFWSIYCLVKAINRKLSWFYIMQYCVILGCIAGIILYMLPSNERWYCNVTPSLIGWTHIQNDP